jgi:hypothetical protein
MRNNDTIRRTQAYERSDDLAALFPDWLVYSDVYRV